MAKCYKSVLTNRGNAVAKNQYLCLSTESITAMKMIFNLDKVRICLQQPENFYDYLYNTYHNSNQNEIRFDGFYLSFDDEQSVNDKDITAHLFLVDDNPVELGVFTFNKSQKYGSKCFFSYSTKALYEIDNVYTFKDKREQYNYFNYPFAVFSQLGLTFNNVTSVEIACDTDTNVVAKIQSAVGKTDVLDMILLNKKVNPDDVLVGYWEFYQRNRMRKASRPTIYVHRLKQNSGEGCSLKVYDKAREFVQSRPDKESAIREWNGMEGKIQRMEITVENKPFKRFFDAINDANPNRWLVHNKQTTSRENKQTEYRQALEHFFFDLGMDEGLRAVMFDYFANHLLHFKMRNHDKTQVSLLDLAVNSIADLRRLRSNKGKSQCKPSKKRV